MYESWIAKLSQPKIAVQLAAHPVSHVEDYALPQDDPREYRLTSLQEKIAQAEYMGRELAHENPELLENEANEPTREEWKALLAEIPDDEVIKMASMKEAGLMGSVAKFVGGKTFRQGTSKGLKWLGQGARARLGAGAALGAAGYMMGGGHGMALGLGAGLLGGKRMLSMAHRGRAKALGWSRKEVGSQLGRGQLARAAAAEGSAGAAAAKAKLPAAAPATTVSKAPVPASAPAVPQGHVAIPGGAPMEMEGYAPMKRRVMQPVPQTPSMPASQMGSGNVAQNEGWLARRRGRKMQSEMASMYGGEEALAGGLREKAASAYYGVDFGGLTAIELYKQAGLFSGLAGKAKKVVQAVGGKGGKAVEETAAQWGHVPHRAPNAVVPKQAINPAAAWKKPGELPQVGTMLPGGGIGRKVISPKSNVRAAGGRLPGMTNQPVARPSVGMIGAEKANPLKIPQPALARTQLPGGQGVRLSKRAEAIKIAMAVGCGCDEGWLKQFEGTPLLDQAINIEKQLLEAEKEDLEFRIRENATRPPVQDRNNLWDMQDRMRLAKKELELQLISHRNSQDVSDVYDQTEPQEAPEEQQVAMPRPEAPAEQQQKMASVKGKALAKFKALMSGGSRPPGVANSLKKIPKGPVIGTAKFACLPQVG